MFHWKVIQPTQVFFPWIFSKAIDLLWFIYRVQPFEKFFILWCLKNKWFMIRFISRAPNRNSLTNFQVYFSISKITELFIQLSYSIFSRAATLFFYKCWRWWNEIRVNNFFWLFTIELVNSLIRKLNIISLGWKRLSCHYWRLYGFFRRFNINWRRFYWLIHGF